MRVRQRIVEIEPEAPPILHLEEPRADPLPVLEESRNGWLPFYVGLLAGPRAELIQEPTFNPWYERQVFGETVFRTCHHQIHATNAEAIEFGVVMNSMKIWAMAIYSSWTGPLIEHIWLPDQKWVHPGDQVRVQPGELRLSLNFPF